MRTMDPEFWKELTGTQNHSADQDLPGLNKQLPEDIEPDSDKSNTSLEDDDADDSDLPISTLINLMTAKDTNLPATVGTRRNGTLTSLADSENDLVGDRIEPADASEGSGEGKGKRKRVANQRYAAFWRHYDEDSYLEDHEKEVA
jgi:hypothetical protein